METGNILGMTTAMVHGTTPRKGEDMYAIDLNQVLWPKDILDAADIPADAKVFLADVGLPPFVANLSVEFGVFEGDAMEFMIGEDGEDRVVINQMGQVNVMKSGSELNLRYINISVAALSQFLCLIGEFRNVQHESLSSFKGGLQQLRSQMLNIDPTAFIDDSHHVWCVLLNDLEAMAF